MSAVILILSLLCELQIIEKQKYLYSEVTPAVLILAKIRNNFSIQQRTWTNYGTAVGWEYCAVTLEFGEVKMLVM